MQTTHPCDHSLTHSLTLAADASNGVICDHSPWEDREAVEEMMMAAAEAKKRQRPNEGRGNDDKCKSVCWGGGEGYNGKGQEDEYE